MQAIERLTQTPLTFIILLAYLTMAYVVGVDAATPRLIEYGASAPDKLYDGQLWRLFSHAFLHSGLLHLGLNSYGLLMLGPGIENALGGPKYALLYAVTALGGGLAANLWSGSVLVGGSGALFGMIGATFAVWVRRGRHPLDFLNYAGPRQLLGLVVINLVFGMLIEVVSNSAHIGGLVSGFVLAYCFLGFRRGEADHQSRAIQAAWVALFAALTLYAHRPVLRWEYLHMRFATSFNERRLDDAQAYAQALLFATDNLRLPAARDGIPSENKPLIRALAKR